MVTMTQKEADEVRRRRDELYNLYSPLEKAGFKTLADVSRAIEEKQAIIRAVNGFKKELNNALVIGDSDWQRILDEVNEIIKERDDTLDQAKIGDILWDAISKQTGIQVVKYTFEGVKALVDSLQTLKMAIPEGFRLLSEEEYKQLMARKTLDRFDKRELLIEFFKRIFE